MNPNNEQAAQLEALKSTEIIRIPQDGITIRNLYVQLIDHAAHICYTCPSTVANYKRKLLAKYEIYLQSSEAKSKLDLAIDQVNELKQLDINKDKVAKAYGKRVVRYRIADHLIYINGSKSPQLQIVEGELVPFDLDEDDILS